LRHILHDPLSSSFKLKQTAKVEQILPLIPIGKYVDIQLYGWFMQECAYEEALCVHLSNTILVEMTWCMTWSTGAAVLNLLSGWACLSVLLLCTDVVYTSTKWTN
jgi:hypothetical protein